MPRRSIEDYKIDLEDKIKSVISKRNDLVLELEKLQKEIEVLMEQQYALDETKSRAECLVCHGAGYVSGDDKKKHVCQLCGGKQYIWVTLWKTAVKDSTNGEEVA